MEDEEEIILGIDLGTTNSVVGYYDHTNERVEIFTNENGNRTTPSYVSFTDTQKLVGEAAKARQSQNVENTIYSAKRVMGRPFSHIRPQDLHSWPFKVTGTPEDCTRYRVKHKGEELVVSPEEVCSIILTKLKTIAKDYLNKPCKKAVITVPAYFTEPQKQATKDAGQLAGIDVVKLITEPTAAALAYGLDKRSLEGAKSEKAKVDGFYILVLDLGGGTFDVSVLKLDGRGSFITKAVTGDFHLGGEDFDDVIIQEFVRKFKRQNPGVDLTRKSMHKIRVECEKSKQVLSQLQDVTIELEIQGCEFEFTLSRKQFNELCADLYERMMEEVKRALELSNLSRDEIDDLVLVGGSTRIPYLHEKMQQYFHGKTIWNRINPDEAVAYGAAIVAATLAKSNASKNGVLSKLTLTNVTPITLGIELSDGGFDVLIPRATRMPCVKSEFYTTAIDNQRSVVIKVSEGEHNLASHNCQLGRFSLILEPAPAGVPKVQVKFTVTADGLLCVSAAELNTGKCVKVEFEKFNLTEDEKRAIVGKGCDV